MPNHERYSQRQIENKTHRIVVDGNIIPSLRRNEVFPMTIAHFPDHGRPCFVGSAIKSNPVFLELARQLTPEESKKVNERFNIEVEKILDGDQSRKVATWTAKDKPDIHMLSIGESFDPRSLRLYYTRGDFKGIPAIYQLAVTRLKDTDRVERIFREAGYQGSKNWEKRRVH